MTRRGADDGPKPQHRARARSAPVYKGEVVALRWRPRTLFRLAGGCAAFALAGAWVLGWLPDRPDSQPEPALVALGIAALVPGALGAIWFASLPLRTRSAVLVLDDQGFVDRSSAMAAGRVGWTEVEQLELREVAGCKAVVCRVRDGDALQARRGRVARLVAGTCRQNCDVWIPKALLPLPIEQVHALMLERWHLARTGRQS